MNKSPVEIGGRSCFVRANGSPRVLLIQPCDESDMRESDSGLALLSEREKDFIHVAFPVLSWNDDLSPWQASPVFGKNGFGGQAERTLGFINDVLIPVIRTRYVPDGDIPVVLGGYSLAGLFSLWAGYVCGSFSAVCAASPSVWFPGWIEFAKDRAPKAKVVYLSLGDREEKAKNPVMARVGDCIREQYSFLQSAKTSSVLEWNEGNHFKDAGIRTAKGFAWCVENLKS